MRPLKKVNDELPRILASLHCFRNKTMSKRENMNWYEYVPVYERVIKKKTLISCLLFPLNFSFRNRHSFRDWTKKGYTYHSRIIQ